MFVQLTKKPKKKLESSTSEHAILVPHIYLREVASLSSPSLQEAASACHGSLQARYLDHALTAVATYLWQGVANVHMQGHIHHVEVTCHGYPLYNHPALESIPYVLAIAVLPSSFRILP